VRLPATWATLTQTKIIPTLIVEVKSCTAVAVNPLDNLC